MLSRRPLLYLTIPSLAILIGLWFRRKKAIEAQCDKGGGGSKGATTTTRSGEPASRRSQEQSIFALPSGNGKPDISESVPIGAGGEAGDAAQLNTSGGSNASHASGKSGPISIGPNSRSPPIPIANKGNCGHTSDELNSIDEFDVESSVSPVDLPGSYERRNFEFVKNSHLYNKRTKGGSMDQQPKVITASKSPKISPKNAFSEANSPPPTTQPKTPDATAVVEQQQQQEVEEALVKMTKLSWAEGASVVTTNNNSNGVEKQKIVDNDIKATTISEQIPSQQLEEDNKNNHTITTGTEEAPAESTAAAASQQPPTISSPPLSLYSVHSNDSGKGASPTQSEAEAAAAGSQAAIQCYEFLINEKYAGMIIGRSGQVVKKLYRRFNVALVVRRPTNCPRLTDRVCSMEGTMADIEASIKYMRSRLNLDKYPDITFERVHYATAPADQGYGAKSAGAGNKQPVMPIIYPVAQLPLSLSLVEGINNDVVISAILNGGHVFLQQPSHPSYQQLQTLYALISASYATGESPALELTEPGSICVAPVGGSWYRVVIVSSAEGHCVVKFLDFGGSVVVPAADLRQIRTDFMALPFQSTECVLSNLRPIGGEWSPAAADLVLRLSNGNMLQAQIAGYTPEGLPEIFLYSILGPDNIAFINQELVAQGFAEWVEDEEEEEDDNAEQAVDANQQQQAALVQ